MSLPVDVVTATALNVADYSIPYIPQFSNEGGRRKVQPGLAFPGLSDHWQPQVNELTFYWHSVRDGTAK